MRGPTDDLDDPDAPWPTSVVQIASAIVEDDSGAILLRQSPDGDRWELPGGSMEPGEEIQDTAVRNVREETGFDIRLTGLVGIYPGDVTAADGQIREEFNVCFAATFTGDRAARSGAPHGLAFVTPDRLTRYPLDPTTRRCIDDHLGHRRSSEGHGT